MDLLAYFIVIEPNRMPSFQNSIFVPASSAAKDRIICQIYHKTNQLCSPPRAYNFLTDCYELCLSDDLATVLFYPKDL